MSCDATLVSAPCTEVSESNQTATWESELVVPGQMHPCSQTPRSSNRNEMAVLCKILLFSTDHQHTTVLLHYCGQIRTVCCTYACAYIE